MRFFVTHDPTGEMRGGLLRGKGSDPTFQQVKKLIKKDIDINEMKRMDYIEVERRWRGEHKQTRKKMWASWKPCAFLRDNVASPKKSFLQDVKTAFQTKIAGTRWMTSKPRVASVPICCG